MKKYRALVPIVMIVLMLSSWYMLIKNTVNTDNEYNTYLSEARNFAEMGITKYAIENYNKALDIKPTLEINLEVAKYYKSQQKNDNYLSWSKDLLKIYPNQAEAYDALLDAYLIKKDYESCFDILEIAKKRNITSDYIEQISSDIMYTYKLGFSMYDDVSVYSNNFCPVKKKETWGFVDRYGNQKISCNYAEVGGYTQTNFTSVVNKNGDAYFIDKTGSKVLVSKEKYECFGLLVGNKVAAKTANNKYTYLDNNLNKLFGNFDYASTFNNGFAAVKKDDYWNIIDDSGNEASAIKYLDVVLDEKQIAYRNDRLFVSIEEGKYIMVDKTFNQVGNLVFEDAKLFLGDAPAAVKINDKWCFVNANGERISDKTYQYARSYSNGLAAVCIDGKWGFVDLDENIVIETKFFDAKDFNEKGSCFVKTGDKWQLLKMYRLNRED